MTNSTDSVVTPTICQASEVSRLSSRRRISRNRASSVSPMVAASRTNQAKTHQMTASPDGGSKQMQNQHEFEHGILCWLKKSPHNKLRPRVKHVPVKRWWVFGNRDAFHQHLRGSGEMAQCVWADVHHAASSDKTGQVLTRRSVVQRADGTGQGFDAQAPGFANQEQRRPPSLSSMRRAKCTAFINASLPFEARRRWRKRRVVG